jgi:hypothetical protein
MGRSKYSFDTGDPTTRDKVAMTPAIIIISPPQRLHVLTRAFHLAKYFIRLVNLDTNIMAIQILLIYAGNNHEPEHPTKTVIINAYRFSILNDVCTLK